MPPKKQASEPSKKAVQKHKQKKLEELTFGLKNKNKSAKVQQYVQSMEKTVMNANARQRQLEEKKKQEKLAAKARKKAMELERDALFNEALLAVSKKTAHDAKAGKIEAKGRDAEDDSNKKQTSSAMKLMYQMDAKEMYDKLHEDVSFFVRCVNDAREGHMLDSPPNHLLFSFSSFQNLNICNYSQIMFPH